MCVCVRLCACAVGLRVCVCVCVCAPMRVCVCVCAWISDTAEEDDDLYDFVEDDDNEGDEIYEDLMRTEQVPEAVSGEHTLLFTVLVLSSEINGNPYELNCWKIKLYFALSICKIFTMMIAASILAVLKIILLILINDTD